MEGNTNADAQATQVAHFAELIDSLILAWADLTKGSEAERAYLLFNRWDDNPRAEELSEQFPKWPRDRVTVPDTYFEHRPERSPCLLELPEELTQPESGLQQRPLKAWLAHCLAATNEQVIKRIPKQDFCGVVICPEKPQAIVRHWIELGDQRPPLQDASVLFRYQDPRVMQRVWPALSPLQQNRWLGPVTHWWSLLQPWGPFNGPSKPARWFHAKRPLLPRETQTGGSPRNLFDETQWFLSGISPAANTIWRGYAENRVAAEAQPTASGMLQMLEDGQRLGLEGENLDDYVWTTWMQTPDDGPARAMDWSLPHLAPVLNRIQAQLRQQPDARFSTLLNKNIQSQKG